MPYKGAPETAAADGRYSNRTPQVSHGHSPPTTRFLVDRREIRIRSSGHSAHSRRLSARGDNTPRRFQQADARYRVRKFVVFLGYGVGLLFLVAVFGDRLGRISLVLGVAGAGIVVALQDVVASVGGWFAIGASKLHTVGDRIRIGDSKGDVIDISILRTTVLESGNWVSGDLHNGRLARIPNSLVLKGPVFNYTQGFRFVWDEIKITLTPQSNHRFARTMLLEIAQETVADFIEEAQHTWKDIKDDYRIENPGLEPIVTLAVNGGSLEFTVSYIVDYAQRTLMKDRLFTRIADEIANSQGRLEWAFSGASSSSASQESSPAASLSR